MPRRLDPRNLYALVRLDMRPQADVVSMGDLAHPLGVTANTSYIKQK
jgi:hypothetical protein